METKFRKDETGSMMRRWEGGEEGKAVRDSYIGIETRYAMGSHACVSSSPAGGGVCSFFSSPLSLVLLPSFSLFWPISLSFRCRSSALGSVPVSKLLVLPMIPSFPLFVAFRSRISASPLNNCPLRDGLKGYASEESIEPRDREMHGQWWILLPRIHWSLRRFFNIDHDQVRPP